METEKKIYTPIEFGDAFGAIEYQVKARIFRWVLYNFKGYHYSPTNSKLKFIKATLEEIEELKTLPYIVKILKQDKGVVYPKKTTKKELRYKKNREENSLQKSKDGVKYKIDPFG